VSCIDYRALETYILCSKCTSSGPAMHTKLTLRLDDALIRRAKRYSEKTGKPLSQLVAHYFALIDSNEEAPETELTPRVRSLLGALREASASEEDYKRYLEKKHS